MFKKDFFVCFVEDYQGVRVEVSQEIFIIIYKKDVSGGNGSVWLDFRYILKLELLRFFNGLNVECEKREDLWKIFKIFSLNNQNYC